MDEMDELQKTDPDFRELQEEVRRIQKKKYLIGIAIYAALIIAIEIIWHVGGYAL